MQGREDRVLFLLGNDSLLLVLVHLLGVEPGLEHPQVVENLGQQEIVQGSQLREIVQERSAGEKMPAGKINLNQIINDLLHRTYLLAE